MTSKSQENVSSPSVDSSAGSSKPIKKESQEEKETRMKKQGKALAEKAAAARLYKKQQGAKIKRRSKSDKAGILFSVDQVLKVFRKSFPQHKISDTAGVYMSAVLEYMCSEMLDLSGVCARDHKRKRIIPRDLRLAISSDQELNNLLSNVIIAEGGVQPFIHESLIKPSRSAPPKKNPSKKVEEEDKEVASQRASSPIDSAQVVPRTSRSVEREEKRGKRKRSLTSLSESEESDQSPKMPRTDVLKNLSQEDQRAVVKYFDKVQKSQETRRQSLPKFSTESVLERPIQIESSDEEVASGEAKKSKHSVEIIQPLDLDLVFDTDVQESPIDSILPKLFDFEYDVNLQVSTKKKRSLGSKNNEE